MKRKFLSPVFLLMIFPVLSSCMSREQDEASLLLYARSSAAYSEGRFGDAAKMLGGFRFFHPALVLRGKAEYFSGQDEAAEKTLRRALTLRPASPEAVLYLARLLRDRGEGGKAESLIENLLAGDPSNVRALRLAAELSRLKGPAGEAASLAFLDRAVEASSETALVFVDRSRFRWIAGNGEGALEDLRRARELLPEKTSLLRGIQGLESAIKEAME